MKKRIYVVEDDPSIRGLYEMALAEAQFAVSCFATAEEFFDALGRAKRRTYP